MVIPSIQPRFITPAANGSSINIAVKRESTADTWLPGQLSNLRPIRKMSLILRFSGLREMRDLQRLLSTGLHLRSQVSAFFSRLTTQFVEQNLRLYLQPSREGLHPVAHGCDCRSRLLYRRGAHGGKSPRSAAWFLAPYHAVPGNLPQLKTFVARLRRLWRLVLMRRSRKGTAVLLSGYGR